MHNQYFTDEEEHSIAEFIRETFINQGLLFINTDFRVLAMQAFLEKGMITHPNEIDESDDYYSDNEEELNNDPENDEEADDANEAEFDFQEEAADLVDKMLHKKTSLHRHHKSTHSTTVCRKSRVFRKLHSQNFSVRSWNIKSFFFDTESESAEQRKFK